MHRNTYRLATYRLVLSALACALLATPASAQDRERLLSEIETTQRILDRAREVVEETGSLRADEPLTIAERLQEQARTLAQSDRRADWVMAFERTIQARKLAQRAMSIAAQQAQLQQRAQQEIFRLERLLEQIREHADTAPSDRAVQLLDMADRRLLQARQAYHERRFEEALNLAQDARRLLENLAPKQPAQRFDRLFENTERLLERAEEAAASSDNPQAQMLFERAQHQFEAARRTHADGRPEAAFRHLTQARDLAMRCLRLDEGPVNVDRLDKLLEDTRRYIESVASRIDGQAGTEAATMLDNARRRMERADSLRAEERYRESLAEARIARNLAQRALDLARDATP